MQQSFAPPPERTAIRHPPDQRWRAHCLQCELVSGQAGLTMESDARSSGRNPFFQAGIKTAMRCTPTSLLVFVASSVLPLAQVYMSPVLSLNSLSAFLMVNAPDVMVHTMSLSITVWGACAPG